METNSIPRRQFLEIGGATSSGVALGFHRMLGAIEFQPTGAQASGSLMVPGTGWKMWRDVEARDRTKKCFFLVKLCPKLIVLSGDFERYEQFSNWMFGYCYDFTPDVEQTSIVMSSN